MKIGILLFDDVEVLDVAGPYEVLTTASRVAARAGGAEPFEVVLLAAAGTTDATVRSRPGLRLGVDATLADAPALDLVLVPGGVTDAVERDAAVLDWLRGRPAPLLASVCTGAFVLAAAGLLADQEVTTHWEDVPELRRRHPGLTVRADRRWVRDGDVWTSAGISAGIDLALHLVATYADRQLAAATARQMDYRWVEGDAG